MAVSRWDPQPKMDSAPEGFLKTLQIEDF